MQHHIVYTYCTASAFHGLPAIASYRTFAGITETIEACGTAAARLVGLHTLHRLCTAKSCSQQTHPMELLVDGRRAWPSQRLRQHREHTACKEAEAADCAEPLVGKCELAAE